MELGEEFSSGRGGVGKLLLRMIGLHGICESGFTLRACRTCRRGSQTATNPLFFFIHLQEEVAYFLFLGEFPLNRLAWLASNLLNYQEVSLSKSCTALPFCPAHTGRAR